MAAVVAPGRSLTPALTSTTLSCSFRCRQHRRAGQQADTQPRTPAAPSSQHAFLHGKQLAVRKQPSHTTVLSASSVCSIRHSVHITDVQGAIDTVAVQFNLKHTCDFGESFAVVGSGPQLGDWDPSCAIPLEWQEDGSWAGQILLNAGERVEYKYLLQGKGSQPSWQPGENLVLALDSITPNGDVVVRVEDPWVGESTWQVEGGEVFTINVDEEKPSSSKPAEEVLDAGHEQRRAPRSAKGFTGGSDAEAEAGSPKVLQAQLPARNISGSDAAEVSWPVASTAAMSSEAQWEESRQSQHMQKVDAKQASPTSLASMAKISGWWKDLLGIWPQTPPQQSGHDRHG